MLDIRWIRQNPEEVSSLLKKRQYNMCINDLLRQDEEKRSLLSLAEEKKSIRNTVGKKIGIARKKGQSANELETLMSEMHQLDEQITDLDASIAELSHQIDQILLSIPNLPHQSVPHSHSPKNDTEIRHWGTPRQFLWEPKSHWDIGNDLEIIDWHNASRITGMASVYYRGMGARLERVLVHYILSNLASKGFLELQPSSVVNLTYLAKCGYHSTEADDVVMYNADSFLVPSAAIPILSLVQDAILNPVQLPVLLCDYIDCFQKKDITKARSLLSLNQNRQIGLVAITAPDNSYIETNQMVALLETILQKLQLPYRIVTSSVADLTFRAAKTYVIEGWLPSQNNYIEVCSITNSEAFLSRRLNVRFRTAPKEKPQHVHMVECSLIIDHLIAAILENNQNGEGTVQMPEALFTHAGTDIIR